MLKGVGNTGNNDYVSSRAKYIHVLSLDKSGNFSTPMRGEHNE